MSIDIFNMYIVKLIPLYYQYVIHIRKDTCLKRLAEE